MSQFETNKRELDELCRRRFFFRPGSDIYGGVAGFFTYGPPGCALKTNIIQQWRNHFVIEEQMMEIEDTNIMPHQVLKASGHVDRFSDFLVRDVANSKTYFRADKLLEEVMDKKMQEPGVTDATIKELTIVRNLADGYSKQELMEVFKKYNVRCPDNGNELTDPEPFNLMFPTPIGPAGLIQGYLRPETAQGIFLNYKFCLEQNSGRLPMGVAQVGKVYRNEIAPRQGLTRQREFSQMEIEWFHKPTAKDTPKFKTVKDLKLQLFPSKEQLAGDSHLTKTIGDAVTEGTVNNETLGYFIARTHLFLISLGCKSDHIRFRQHLPTEMAHYAADCWDAEIETSIGWLECVGIADRACFDLNAHAEASKVDLMFRETVDPPIVIEVTQITKAAGVATMKAFKKQGKAVKEWLEALPEADLRALADEAKAKGKADRTVTLGEAKEVFTFLPDHVAIETKQEKRTTNCFMPGVVEPSFGIDRIFFACIEHSYYARAKEDGEEEKQTRGVLSFPAGIAPYKMTILPVDQRVTRDEKYVALMTEIRDKVSSLGHTCNVDDSGVSIGKRYSRNDELGIPFAVTVDFDSIKDGTVTVRERDSMAQVRMPASKVATNLHEIIWGRKAWKDVQTEFAGFTSCGPK